MVETCICVDVYKGWWVCEYLQLKNTYKDTNDDWL